MIPESETPAPKPKKKKSIFKRILKTVLWFLLAVCLLIIAACSLVVWYLTPEKLTPLVKDAAEEYLNAEVNLDKVELTFWHTFPKLTVDVDNLEIISNSLRQLPDSVQVTLPADADSLMSVSRIHAGINLALLGIGEIALYDVEIESPRLNLVAVNESCTNFDIIPPSEPDTTATEIPSISINRFKLSDANAIRFRNLTDSTDVALLINNVDFKGDEAPHYRIYVDMEGHSPLLQNFNIHNFPVSVNGNIKWDNQNPLAVELDDFKLNADSVLLNFSTAVDFADTLKINSFKGEVSNLHLTYILDRLPEDVRKNFQGLKTNLSATIKAEFTRPYLPLDTLHPIPSMNCRLEIPSCKVDYHNMHWHNFEVNLAANIDGMNLNKSEVNLKRLIINGHAMDIDLKGEASDLLTDPYLNGEFRGKLNLEKLPPVFVRKFANKFSGNLSADLKFRGRKSYLQLNHFHRARVEGMMKLNGFEYISTDSATSCYINESSLDFGTNRRFTTDAAVVDSLLTLSLKIDTGSVNHSTISLKIKDMKGGVGTRLTRNTGNRNQISGFGGMLMFGTVRLTDSADSLLMRITDVKCNASLKRYQGEASVPELSLIFDADRMIGANPEMIAGLNKGHFNVSAHFRKRRNRVTASGDSVSTVRRLTNRTANEEDIDLEVDSGMKALLRRWNVTGNIAAESGRLFARALPVKNRFSNVNLDFSTDSIILHNLDYTLGRSNFNVKGYVGNLRRSLTNSRRDNKLQINLAIESDTLDVNELSRLAFTDFDASGTDLTATVESGDIDNIGNGEHHAEGVSKAFMVPGNIEAEVDVNARNLIYTDVVFHDFSGQLLVMNKAINLRNLKANADIGSLDMTALYSTLDRDSIQFGMGLKINKFNLAKVLKLFPAIDSVMPMLQNFSGIIDADIAATSQIDSTMNFVIPSLKAAMKLSGDSLVLMDPDTFKFLSKWLMFKDKKRNMIDHLSVEMIVEDNQLEIFPFIFDIDRYKLGVMGSNDLNFNLKYHISVLKSPLPFKFGINISGNVDDMKIRLGGAKFKNNQSIERVSIADTTRINLVRQIENIFRRSANSSTLTLQRRKIHVDNDTVPITAADSLLMIKEGFITPDSTNVQ